MLLYTFVILQILYSVSCQLSCYNCPFEVNIFDYLITTDKFPTELKNCSLQSNYVKCFIEVNWQRAPDITTITLVGEVGTKSVSTDNSLVVDVGFVNEESISMWKKLLYYECNTDQCNSLSELKRILNSLTMSDTLTQLAYLLNPVKPFQGQWCARTSNATFAECNTTMPDSSCTQCTLTGIMNQTRTELCATCLTLDAGKHELSYGKTYNMTDRTHSTNWMIVCERENCNTPAIGDEIRAKSHIHFDFNKFFNTGNQLTSVFLMNKIVLLFIVFFTKLFY
jgi:hypothetical protein